MLSPTSEAEGWGFCFGLACFCCSQCAEYFQQRMFGTLPWCVRTPPLPSAWYLSTSHNTKKASPFLHLFVWNICHKDYLLLYNTLICKTLSLLCTLLSQLPHPGVYFTKKLKYKNSVSLSIYSTLLPQGQKIYKKVSRISSDCWSRTKAKLLICSLSLHVRKTK